MSDTQQHAHRLEIAPTDEQVIVARDGVELADSRQAITLREGSLPLRYYIPKADVRMDLLTPTDSSTSCPFKGDARYWSIDGAPDIAWCYETPIPGAEKIAGLVCFYNEKVDLEVDGVLQERPTSPWS